jgi:ATP adenylyltransferase
LERLWSGWRASYVQSRGSDAEPGATQGSNDGASVFTQLLQSELPDEQTHIVYRGDMVFAIVNIHPYTSGHLLVLPYREVADLAELTKEEGVELWTTVNQAVAAVRRVYAPDGLNIGLNLGRPAGGSVPTHLHVHVVPRWTGDSNFMSAIANTQTLPEALNATADRLRRAWASSS